MNVVDIKLNTSQFNILFTLCFQIQFDMAHFNDTAELEFNRLSHKINFDR